MVLVGREYSRAGADVLYLSERNVTSISTRIDDLLAVMTIGLSSDAEIFGSLTPGFESYRSRAYDGKPVIHFD